jgi:hypothetical protein
VHDCPGGHDSLAQERVFPRGSRLSAIFIICPQCAAAAPQLAFIFVTCSELICEASLLRSFSLSPSWSALGFFW